MNTLSYKTLSANKNTVTQDWIVVDAENQVLGRFASQIASILKGKNKVNYTPHVDCGDRVIVINAEKIRLTGKKLNEKVYIRYTGYPGGQRFATPRQLLATHPERVLEKAIKGMLPKNRLGRALFGNLYVYQGNTHPHSAQNPKSITF